MKITQTQRLALGLFIAVGAAHAAAQAQTCESDDDCEAGSSCHKVGSISCEEDGGECETTGTQVGEATCKPRNYGGGASKDADDGGCSVQSVHARNTPFGLLSLLGVGLVRVARRRRSAA